MDLRLNFAAVRLSRLFWPLPKASHGSIINIIGAAARTPGPDFLIGGSVNAAFANFAKGLAAIGNRDDVNVNVIHPGMVETDRVVTSFQQFASRRTTRRRKRHAKIVSLKAARGASVSPTTSLSLRCFWRVRRPGIFRVPQLWSTAARRRDFIEKCRGSGAAN
jgi:NAD(P)-dependent dehydrogenase (short-subunit alcohol dehydrogenase family)